MSDTLLKLEAAIERLQQRDPAAKNELLGLAYRRLERLTSRMLDGFERLRKQGEDTGDLLHEAMLQLSDSLEKVPIGTPREFLALAAEQIRRTLIDFTRRHFGRKGFRPKPRKARGDSRLQSVPESESKADGDWLVDWTELHERVEALPEKEREIVNLLWYLDLSQSEAAAVLGVDASTVKRRWQRARRSLQGFLRNWLPG